MVAFLSWIKKAIIAGAASGGAAAVEQGRIALSDGTIAQSEWVTIVGTFVVVGVLAGGAVFAARNGPKPTPSPTS